MNHKRDKVLFTRASIESRVWIVAVSCDKTINVNMSAVNDEGTATSTTYRLPDNII